MKTRDKIKKKKNYIHNDYSEIIKEEYSELDSIFNMDDETFIHNTLISVGLKIRNR